MPNATPTPRSLPLRIWHWSNALIILGSLGTVFLRKTFLSYRTNGPLIEAKVAEVGGTVSSEGAVAVAKLLRDQMWGWHYTLGTALAVLLIVRVVIAFLPRSTQGQPAGLHKRLVNLLYIAFYILLSAMVLTGLSMYWSAELGLPDAFVHLIKDVHEWMMWGFVGFVPIHVGGVVIAELRGERGLISNMIHGGKP